MNTVIIIIAKYLFVVILGIVLGQVFLLPKADRSRAIKIGALSGIVALILTWISGQLIHDPRPFVVTGTPPLFPHPVDNGFPSDHTILSMLAALISFFNNKKLGTVLIILAFVVGFSRVLAGVHHPLDIFGGAMIALVSVVGAKKYLKQG